MKRSSLHDDHAKRGAIFVEQSGWEVPDHYGDPAAEYSAVRNGAGIMDLASRGRIRVTGEDQVKWLQSIISNDILPLAPGQGIYSTFLTHKGKILAYFRVYQLGDALLIEDVGETGDATFSALRKFLLFGTKAKMENCGESWGQLLISGPKTLDLIRSTFGTDISSLKPLAFERLEIEGYPALLIRSEETGETDINILVPSGGLRAVWDRLWAVGNSMGLKPIGRQALEILRVEAGLPKMGQDLTEEIVPPEANLEGKSFSLSKGCYPGQEVVARMDTYGSVRRRLVGLTLLDSAVPVSGAKLYSGDREVGWVSSAVLSPSLGKVIALGFPLRDFTKPGTELELETDGHRVRATVQELPFVRPSSSP
ncbi:MAG TPA: aminomethyltransferase family protein [Nitrospirales bacterium]